MGYYDVMRQRVTLGSDRISLRVKAGLISWEEVETASMLMADNIEIQPGARVLVLQSGSGALVVWAAWQGADVHCYDSSILATRLTRETLAANDVQAAVYDSVCPASSEAETFDTALLVIPKGRAFSRLLLGAAYHALKPGGRLYLAGPNAGGAKAIVKDAGAIFGRAATIHSKARNRVAVAVKLVHAQGEAVPSFERLHELDVAGLSLCSIPGVFSWEELDDGTARLLDTLGEDLCIGQRVLDVGCGTGVIGLYAARLGAASVDMIDSSFLAVQCAQEGILANGFAATCHAWTSDLYSDAGDEPYNLILSNPPFHIGHAVETEAAQALISGARDRLVNLFLPYERLLKGVFGERSVRIVQEDTRYRVIEGVLK